MHLVRRDYWVRRGFGPGFVPAYSSPLEPGEGPSEPTWRAVGTRSAPSRTRFLAPEPQGSLLVGLAKALGVGVPSRPGPEGLMQPS